jgi:hypothetical protein
VKSKGRLESDVKAGVIAYLSIRQDLFFWRANTGAANFNGYYVQFGLKGAADIQGVQGPNGRFFGIETKREIGGRVSGDQERWGAAVVSAGGIYVVSRDVAVVAAALGPELARVVKPTKPRHYPR